MLQEKLSHWSACSLYNTRKANEREVQLRSVHSLFYNWTVLLSDLDNNIRAASLAHADSMHAVLFFRRQQSASIIRRFLN